MVTCLRARERHLPYGINTGERVPHSP